jgi:predicted TIM-barrel fold metal-dependent hydrolase
MLLLLACAEEPEGVLYQGTPVDVVDMHLHPGEWEEIPPSTQAYLASRFPFPFSLTPESLASSVLTGEGILEQLDDARIGRGMLFAVYAPRTVGVASNTYVGEQLAAAPSRLYGLASLRVDNWEEDEAQELDDLAAAVDDYGFHGIKLAHAHQNFRMDDPRFYSIYALAADKGLPVYLHTGTSPFPGTAQDAPYTDPAYLEDAIALHPDTTFILGHLGYDFIAHQHAGLDTCIRLAQDYPNVYLEPSALGSKGSDPEGTNLPAAYAAMKEGGVVDRIVYGSDGPQSPGFVGDYLERSMSAMESAGYTPAEAQAVLAGNFDTVFVAAP